MNPPDRRQPEPSAETASTDWTLVLEAASEASGLEALDRLCRTYWRPIFDVLRQKRMSEPDAKDATQAFFAEVLTKKWIQKARQDRGSFRAFLREHLSRFLANRWRHENAQKRKGLAPDLPLDTEASGIELEALNRQMDPAQAFDRAWAMYLLETALQKLGCEYEAAGSLALFKAISPFIQRSPEDREYERLEEELHFRRGQVAKRVHDLRRRFQALFRAEVAGTLADRRGVDEELRALLRALKT